MNDPRPQCAECGGILHPHNEIVIISEGPEMDESIPEGMAMGPILCDMFSGLYCSSDCVLDSLRRGWPEWRALSSDFSE